MATTGEGKDHRERVAYPLRRGQERVKLITPRHEKKKYFSEDLPRPPPRPQTPGRKPHNTFAETDEYIPPPPRPQTPGRKSTLHLLRQMSTYRRPPSVMGAAPRHSLKQTTFPRPRGAASRKHIERTLKKNRYPRLHREQSLYKPHRDQTLYRHRQGGAIATIGTPAVTQGRFARRLRYVLRLFHRRKGNIDPLAEVMLVAIRPQLGMSRPSTVGVLIIAGLSSLPFAPHRSRVVIGVQAVVMVKIQPHHRIAQHLVPSRKKRQ